MKPRIRKIGEVWRCSCDYFTGYGFEPISAYLEWLANQREYNAYMSTVNET